MNLEELAKRCIHLGVAPSKSIQVALEYEQAMRKLEEQNLDRFYSDMERGIKNLLRMADEKECTEGKAMKWSEMPAEQRDRLVHERVMGHSPDEQCTGIFWSTTDMRTGECECQCSGCGAHYDTDDTLVYEHRQPNVPAYTIDMNAAWQVIQRLVKLYGDDTETNFDMYWQKNEFFQAMNLEPYFEAKRDEMGITLAKLAVWTPERICLAALRACNMEVEI